jgi:thiol-disulfide isomerase/thioredoxin
MANRLRKAALSGLALVIIISIGLAGYYFGRIVPLIKAGKQQGIYSAASDRRTVAGFGFETLNGLRLSIENLRGKVVVIDVWATWCGTCIQSIPRIAELHQKYRGRPVEFIGVDVDDDGWEKVRPFLKKHPEILYTIAVPYPVSAFQFKTIVDLKPLGNVSAIPTVFVADREGRLAGKFVGLGHEKEIDRLIELLLQE